MIFSLFGKGPGPGSRSSHFNASKGSAWGGGPCLFFLFLFLCGTGSPWPVSSRRLSRSIKGRVGLAARLARVLRGILQTVNPECID